MPFKIRPATHSDLEVLRPLASDTSRNLALEEELRATEADRYRCFWVAERQGQVFGFAIARAVLDEAEILAIATLQEARRQGVARQLLVELADTLQSLGVRQILLEVAEDNQPALACYRGLGFVETGRRARYYPNGSAAILMDRSLGRKGLRPLGASDPRAS